MLGIIFLLLAVGLTTQTPLFDTNNHQCGYESCPKYRSDVLNVHIVPHTHDDVGWLKTVDQYYFGSRNNIQKAGVQYILDSVVKELWQDPKRRFIYVETAFFWKWWTRQPKSIRDKVRVLVRDGRLQFVGGAWSMNDEAATHYQSTVDQFTHGLRKLNQTFGPCALPRVGWQIDPFGHSREFASDLAQMGYDGLFLGRIDYQDKTDRKKNLHMEMIWRGDDDLGESSDIFTGILYNTYSPPPGFCFDVLCNDEPIIDDPDSPMYNVDNRIDDFLSYIGNQSLSYRTNNVIVTMGGDFTYQDANMWYTNLDKLIEYTNLKAAKDGLNVSLFYSTPNCYLKAVKDANPTLPIKQDDFFPYASDPNAFWTGYFTSRPTTKYFEREGNNYLQMAKQLQVLAGLDEHNMFVLNELKGVMGVMQHHDAVTGTEKDHVTHDYERMLTAAIDDSLYIAREAFNKIMQGDALKPQILSFDRCHLNESRCDVSEDNDRFVVTVYNPLGWTLKRTPVRVPVPDGEYSVIAPNGEEIETQMVDIPSKITKIPTRESKATHEIVFLAYNVQALGYKSFYVQKKKKTKRDTQNINEYWKNIRERSNTRIIEEQYKNVDNLNAFNGKDFNENTNLNALKDNNEMYQDANDESKMIEDAKSKLIQIANDVRNTEKKRAKYFSLNDDEMRMLSDDPMIVERSPEEEVYSDGKIKFRINHTTGEKTMTLSNGEVVTLNIHYYPGCVGNNEIYANRSSGAYIFRPNATKSIKIQEKHTKTITGPIVSEITTESDYTLSTIIAYADLDFIDLDWVVGPIPIDDDVGKEIIVKYNTNIDNGKVFYTDSNGRQILKRKIGERPQFNVTLFEPIAGNYYPVTNKIYIEDGSYKFSVFTDRSQGGSSLESGKLEVMLHRRLLHDDAFGVGEALNETAKGFGLVARGTHRFPIDAKNVTQDKRVALELHLKPRILISNAKDLDLTRWLTLKNCYGPLKNDLPFGVHLLTLEPWGRSLLMRLENYLEKTEMNATTVDVDVSQLFTNLQINSLKETTLAANAWKNKQNKWTWNTENDFKESFNKDYGNTNSKMAVKEQVVADDGFTIKLKAKQIKTFIVNYEFIGF